MSPRFRRKVSRRCSRQGSRRRRRVASSSCRRRRCRYSRSSCRRTRAGRIRVWVLIRALCLLVVCTRVILQHQILNKRSARIKFRCLPHFQTPLRPNPLNPRRHQRNLKFRHKDHPNSKWTSQTTTGTLKPSTRIINSFWEIRRGCQFKYRIWWGSKPISNASHTCSGLRRTPGTCSSSGEGQMLKRKERRSPSNQP